VTSTPIPARSHGTTSGRASSCGGACARWCRTCLERWHAIPKGAPLTAEQRAYVVDVICRWIERQFPG
jgi:hypothetical protein